MMKRRVHHSGNYTVGDWMTPDPFTISIAATLGDAYDCMMECDVRRLPVVDRDGDLVGIITRSDILQVVPPLDGTGEAEGGPPPVSQLPVRDVMAWEPVTVTPADPVQRAATRMIEHQVSGLPVVEGGQLVGIITESDIFRLVVDFMNERGARVRG